MSQRHSSSRDKHSRQRPSGPRAESRAPRDRARRERGSPSGHRHRRNESPAGPRPFPGPARDHELEESISPAHGRSDVGRRPSGRAEHGGPHESENSEPRTEYNEGRDHRRRRYRAADDNSRNVNGLTVDNEPTTTPHRTFNGPDIYTGATHAPHLDSSPLVASPVSPYTDTSTVRLLPSEQGTPSAGREQPRAERTRNAYVEEEEEESEPEREPSPPPPRSPRFRGHSQVHPQVSAPDLRKLQRESRASSTYLPRPSSPAPSTAFSTATGRSGYRTRRHGIGGAGNIVDSEGRHCSARQARRELQKERREAEAAAQSAAPVTQEEIEGHRLYGSVLNSTIYNVIHEERDDENRKKIRRRIRFLESKERKRKEPTFINKFLNILDQVFPGNFVAEHRESRKDEIKDLREQLTKKDRD
ncbi:hypothetical protein L228DRAFT_247772 [Xylona heveae TC161]|uniref:Uncharacterized protein n=1 Tax=Xylona heveae (strain CBS 132557 / TC161) TaxID=1328760 RepID=A0A165GGA5_XYLHT|nr:hypothetical protein L228DRAFT_247772 [Xylona heveae TC161]KZF22148.1 hypothetical protein L228DRAFT_247772 [Xylona heveae TC161]